MQLLHKQAHFLPHYSVYGLLAVILAILYPCSKRVTDYTPVILGIIFAWGSLLGYVSTTDEPIEASSPTRSGLAALSCYTLAWVVNFETIYAFQDIRDDTKAGVMSMAVRYKDSAKLIFGLLILVEMTCLTLTGMAMEAGVAYYLLAPIANTCLQAWTQFRLNLNDPDACTFFFKKVSVTTFLIGAALLSEFLSK